jgi:dTDP-4-amino-4,6-dideoxygalactose transaminase
VIPSEIPFLDLVAVHRELQQELALVFRNTLDAAAFVGGPSVESFEEKFARFCEVPHCVGVGSGTDALRFALLAAGVGKDEIVATVANTFIATTEAISQVGATAKFVDVDEQTYNMDPRKLQEFLEAHCTVNSVTGKLINDASGLPVTCIVPVHLYGQMADMDPILELADRYRLAVVEDACQAHGARYFSKREKGWRKAGSMGIAAAFSFYPGKNLGACGEAGAVTTKVPEIARKVRMLRDHGQAEKYYHDMEGYNGRLDAIQAGILSVKMQHLEGWNASRVEAARRYDDLFAAADVPLILPVEPAWSKPVYHLYVVQANNRDALRRALVAAGIGTGIHYPIPLHLQKAYAGLGVGRGSLPATESAADRILSLPMFPGLSEAQQERVVETVIRSTAHVKATGAAIVPS